MLLLKGLNFKLIVCNVLLQELVTIKRVNKEYPEEVKRFLDERAAQARSARWANHVPMTPEEKRAKRAAYQAEYRRRKKNK